MTPDLPAVLALERQVWEALARGDASADARLLHASFLGVYATGFSNRDEHVGQLKAGPVVANFELQDARLVALTPDLALLAYRAVFHRPSAPAQRMYVSSLWQRFPEGWRNVFSQDTGAS